MTKKEAVELFQEALIALEATRFLVDDEFCIYGNYDGKGNPPPSHHVTCEEAQRVIDKIKKVLR